MGFATRGILLVQLSVLLLSFFSVFGDEFRPPSHPPVHPPVHPPSHPPVHPPHHGGHHHKHGHPPSLPPSHPPVHPPSHPPAYPPSHPPAHPPHPHHYGLPPIHPPVKAPAHPPVKPPTHPPAHPPVHTPRYPPVHPFPRSFVAVEGVVYCKSCKYAGFDTLLGASPVSGATVKLQCNNTKYPAVETAKTDKNGYFFITAPKTVTSYASHKCKVFLISSPVATCSKPSNFNDGLKGSLLRPEKPYVANKLPFVLYTVGPFAFEPTCPR